MVYHQPKKDAVGWEQKLCCGYYDFFVIDFLDSVEYFGCLCVCVFLWSSEKTGDQLEGSEQEQSLDFSAIFESVHIPKFNYFWTLSKMAEKSRDRSCSEPSN